MLLMLSACQLDREQEPSAINKEPSAINKEPSAAEPSATYKEPSAIKDNEPSAESPALLLNPDAETITELELTITTSLYGVPVDLNENAFTSSSLLTLEPRLRKTPQGKLATGRTMERPEQFRLLSTADGCILERMATGNRFILKLAQCTKE
jgi:hypothetical protein